MAKTTRRTSAPSRGAQIIAFPLGGAACRSVPPAPATKPECSDLDVLETMVHAYFTALDMQVAKIRNHLEV